MLLLKEDLKKLQDAGVDMLHLDVMDGLFVPSISFGMPVITSLRKQTDIFFDVHIMIVEPERYAAEFVECGADMVTFHLEATEKVEETIAIIREAGAKVGISIKPGTPVEEIFPYLDKIDMVLVMTVEPGFGGQKFMEDQLEKLVWLRQQGFQGHIAVDGGVNMENAERIVSAGADVLVMGTAFFKAKDRAEVVRKVKELA